MGFYGRLWCAKWKINLWPNNFFMRSPAEERAMLYGLEQFVGDAKVVVSFNGKSFDIPMLHTRFQMQRMPSALFEMAHYDLLHLSRKLWRYNLE